MDVSEIFIFFCSGAGAREEASEELARRGGGGRRTAVKWLPFVLLAFFPVFYSTFASKLAISPLKRSVLGA